MQERKSGEFRTINFALMFFAAAFLIGAGVLIEGAEADVDFEFVEDSLYSGSIYDLWVEDDLLYMAAKKAVWIYDVSTPETPVLLSTVDTPGLANGVHYKDGYLYVGDVYGFQIIDVSDPSSPVTVGYYKAVGDGYPERVRVRDGYAYVAAYDAGLQVFDVSDPTMPALVGSGDTPAYSWHVAVSGNLAFLSDMFSLETFDISDPTQPVHLSSYSAVFGLEVEVEGNLVYLAYIDGMIVLDMSDPENPVEYGFPGITGSGSGESISLENDRVYVGHGAYVDIFDVSDPGEPERIGYYYTHSHPRAIQAVGDLLYIVEDEAGFEIVDVSDPSDPVRITYVNPFIRGEREDVLYHQGLVYLADGVRGLRIYDVSADPAQPQEISSVGLPGYVRNLRLFEDRLVVGADSRIHVLDIQDPATPALLSTIRTTGHPWQAWLEGNTLTAVDLYGIHTFSLENPEKPELQNSYFTSHEGDPYDLVKRGDYLYVAAGHGGMMIFDVSSPLDPTRLARIPDDNSRSYITLKLIANTALALKSSGGIDIYDIVNPAAPALVREFELEGSFNRILVQDDKAFLSNGVRGIIVLDVSTPRNPVIIGSYDTTGYNEGTAINGQYVYIADYYSFAVYRMLNKQSDDVPPETVIEYPAQGDLIKGKFADIFGRAWDDQSGLKKIHISPDNGLSWETAQGLDPWSYRFTPADYGNITVLAKAEDQKGNVEDPPSSVDFDFIPARPQILSAGFLNTRINYDGGRLGLAAWITDPQSNFNIKKVELLYDGIPTGVTLDPLYNKSEDFQIYCLDRQIDASVPEADYEIQIEVEDVYGLKSRLWPYLSVE